MAYLKDKMRNGLFGRLVKVGLSQRLAIELAAASYPDPANNLPTHPTRVRTTDVHGYLETFLKSRERLASRGLQDDGAASELQTLWHHLWGVGIAEYVGEEDAEEEPETPFMVAARFLMDRMYAIEALADDEKQFATACLLTGADAAESLADLVESEADEKDVRNRLSDIRDVGDFEGTGPAVWAMAWFFAFDFLARRMSPEVAQKWLPRLDVAIGPVEAVNVVADYESRLADLLARRIRAEATEDFAAFAVVFAVWVQMHLGLEEDEARADLVSGLLITRVCIDLMPKFAEFLDVLGFEH